MNKRMGFVGIFLEGDRDSVLKVQSVLNQHGSIILGRMGIPGDKHTQRKSVITLIVEADTDELGALTGQLGNIPEVMVKSALSKE